MPTKRAIARKNLLYTIAFDPPGGTIIRSHAKLFLMSVLRTGFDGDIIVFTNHDNKIFPAGRPRLKEIRINTKKMKERELAEYACAFKYRAADYIPKPEQYGRILFTDSDCLALRDLAPLFTPEEDILWALEPGTNTEMHYYGGYFTEAEKAEGPKPGINGGTWSVRGDKYTEVMAAMMEVVREGPTQKEVFWGDQPAWNKLVHAGPFSNKPFDSLDLRFPLAHHQDYKEYTRAALIHMCGGDLTMKTRFMLGTFVDRFYYEAAPILVDLIEA